MILTSIEIYAFYTKIDIGKHLLMLIVLLPSLQL